MISNVGMVYLRCTQIVEGETEMRMLNNILVSLLIVGGLNWLLVGIFGFDLIAFLFEGAIPTSYGIIYILVGVIVICSLSLFKKTND